MGKKKIDKVTLIQDQIQRNVTYQKRKKGLLKKAMEVSILCGQHISLIIYDEKKSKLVVYNSDNTFNSAKISYLQKALKSNQLYEEYTNQTYHNLCESKITCVQSRVDSVNISNKLDDTLSLDKIEEFDELESKHEFELRSPSEMLQEDSVIYTDKKRDVKLSLKKNKTEVSFKQKILQLDEQWSGETKKQKHECTQHIQNDVTPFQKSEILNAHKISSQTDDNISDQNDKVQKQNQKPKSKCSTKSLIGNPDNIPPYKYQSQTQNEFQVQSIQHSQIEDLAKSTDIRNTTFKEKSFQYNETHFQKKSGNSDFQHLEKNINNESNSQTQPMYQLQHQQMNQTNNNFIILPPANNNQQKAIMQLPMGVQNPYGGTQINMNQFPQHPQYYMGNNLAQQVPMMYMPYMQHAQQQYGGLYYPQMSPLNNIIQNIQLPSLQPPTAQTTATDLNNEFVIEKPNQDNNLP